MKCSNYDEETFLTHLLQSPACAVQLLIQDIIGILDSDWPDTPHAGAGSRMKPSVGE